MGQQNDFSFQFLFGFGSLTAETTVLVHFSLYQGKPA